MPLQVIGGHTVYALDSQVAGIARLCAWVEAHRDPTLDFWDQVDDCMRQKPKPRRQRQHRLRPPDGLLTASEAAAKLGCSVKTLNGHVAAGVLKYVSIGHGRKRPRKMFSDADLNQFIADQTRKDAPCPSDVTRAPPTGNTIFKSEVVAFSARRSVRPGGKPRR
jgi:Helix-turn-helix domain